MAAIVFKEFRGLIPRTPPELLPEGTAAAAENCDFSKSVLGALRTGGGSPNTSDQSVLTAVNTIKGVFTDDGSRFYTWPTEVTAYRSPVLDDSEKRIYYIEDSVFKVSVTPDRFAALDHSSPFYGEFTSGGVPPTKIKGGVPSPANAPTLTLVDRTTVPDYPDASMSLKYWWTDGTTKYGEGTASVTGFKTSSFTSAKPTVTVPTGTAQPTLWLVAEATMVTGGTSSSTLFTLQVTSTAPSGARSSALPGGVEMSMTASSNSYTVNFIWGVTESRAYISTYVNGWLEESAPSPAALISPTYLQDVRVSVTGGVAALNTEDANHHTYRFYLENRIYRTYGSASYLRTTLTNTTHTPSTGALTGDDTNHDASKVGAALTTLNYMLPPSTLNGLVALPNGWFAAFNDNKLYMSEPYHPHSWQYSMSFPRPISGICVGPQALVVTTWESAYLVTGAHPASVTSMQLPIPVGGLSHRSMCRTENGVAFLAYDGIVLVEGSQASLDISQTYWTRENFAMSYADVMMNFMLSYADGCLICVSNDATKPRGFVLRADEAKGALTEFNHAYGAMFRLPWADTLYYSEANKLFRFRTAVNGVYNGVTYPSVKAFYDLTWKSREIVLPKTTRFGVGYIRVGNSSGTIKLTFYLDGEPMRYLADASGRPAATLTTGVNVSVHPGYTFTVVSGAVVAINGVGVAPAAGTYFRLPPSLLAGELRWQVQIEITTTTGSTNALELRELTIASTVEELKNV